MDVLRLRQSLIDEYKGLIENLIHFPDEKVNTFVHNALDLRAHSPEPHIQLNHSFERGDSVEKLVVSGVPSFLRGLAVRATFRVRSHGWLDAP